jgi:hypothetical protein
VIRFDAHGERSWGEEHSSASEPDSRSIWYGWAAEYIIARGVATWETSFSFVNDLVLNLRFWLMIPLCVVVLLCAAFHGVMRRPYSLCLLFVMALVPVHVSLAAGITNYGFAILLGACTGSFLFPEGRKRARMLAAVLCGFGLFWVASSSRPCQPLFVVGPFLLMAWPWYAGLMYKKSEAMIPGLLAVGAFLAPVVMLRNTVSVDAWFSQFEPLFNTFVAKLPESSSRLFSTVPRSWFLFSVIGGVGGSTVSMLPLKGVANASALRLWVIAMVVSGWLVLLALAAFFFPVTEFAPNIRFLGDAIPEFSEFLKAVFRSFASQVFSGSQDYYLWQTYFLAYGWLDTTAPQPIYAALKQLVVLAVGISLVGVGSGFILWFRVFCMPFLFAIALWLGALYGAWMTGHTLLGRYVAPFAFLFVIPLFSALYFVLPLQSSPKKLHSGIVVAFFCILGFVLLNFYGVVWLLPTRYLVGI